MPQSDKLTPPATPELDKAQLHRSENDAIGQFLEWCGSRGMELCYQVMPRRENDFQTFAPVGEPITHMLARYRGVDLDIMNTEQLAVLDYMRALNDAHQKTG